MHTAQSQSVLIKSSNWRGQVAFLLCAVVIAGLFLSQYIRVLPGIGISGLVLLSLLQPNLKERIRQLKHQKYLLGFMVLFWVQVLTILYTDGANYGTWWQWVSLKLSLFFLPLAFGLLPVFSTRQFYLLYYFFFWCVFSTALYSLIHYGLHFEEINSNYSRSGIMLTLVNHIRYSLMAVLAFFIGCRLWQQKFYCYHPAERYAVAVITLFLFGFIHLLAVRTGLLALYGILGLGVLYYIIFKKAVKTGVLLGLVLVLVPLFSYWAFPTFHKKIYIIVADLQSIGNESSAQHNSISGRVYSYRVGWHLYKENPVFGVGLGNMRQELRKTYQQHFPLVPPHAYFIPHNQFIFSLMSLGLVGFAVFLFCFFYPWWAHFRQTDLLFSVHYIVITLSFLTDATLETQVGIIFSLLFILLPLQQLQRNSIAQNPL